MVFTPQQYLTKNTIMNLPKIELHCHLDGSVRPETIIDIAKEEKIDIGSFNVEDIKELLVAPLECKSLEEYLEKFDIPNKVMQSNKSLRRITFELLEDAAKENVKYIEVRFAPLLHTRKGLDVEQVLESVIKGIKDAESKFDIKGNVIIGCMRTMSEDSAIEVIESGKKFIGKGVVAVDLCGPELKSFAQNYKKAIALAKNYGYRISIHAGETGIGENVLDSIEILGAERIGHGVYIKNCREAYEIVKHKGITLEMCPTSNIQTKAIDVYKNHPFYDFFNNGIKVSINTDNRTVSDTNMEKESKILFSEFGITKEEYKKIYLDTVEAIFGDEKTKKWLRGFWED